MTAFAKPWETKGADPLIAEALEDTSRRPWDPDTPKVPAHIKQQHKQRAQKQGEYRPETKFKAQAFAKEYLIDFDHRNAMIRLGVDDPDKALELGRAMLNDPETLQAIQAYMGRIEEDKLVTRSRVLAGLLREACYHGLGASHSARVAAWGKLAKVLGMEQPPEDPSKKNNLGGVMIVPMAGGIEEWERAAIGQQRQLKADVRN